MVSTHRCGRWNPGSILGNGSFFFAFVFCVCCCLWRRTRQRRRREKAKRTEFYVSCSVYLYTLSCDSKNSPNFLASLLLLSHYVLLISHSTTCPFSWFFLSTRRTGRGSCRCRCRMFGDLSLLCCHPSETVVEGFLLSSLSSFDFIFWDKKNRSAILSCKN